MYPVKNPTKYALETLEHDIVNLVNETMLTILDNGDRPDKRISAIVGLHVAQQSILRSIYDVSSSIPDAP